MKLKQLGTSLNLKRYVPTGIDTISTTKEARKVYIQWWVGRKRSDEKWVGWC